MEMIQKEEAIHKGDEDTPERKEEGDDSFFRNTRLLIEEEDKEPSDPPLQPLLPIQEEQKVEIPKGEVDNAAPMDNQANAPTDNVPIQGHIGPIFEVIPKAAQAKDLMKAQFLEPIGKRESFAVNVRTQNRQEKLTRRRAMTVARYVEEDTLENNKEEEAEPREEEKIETLPELPPPAEEEKK